MILFIFILGLIVGSFLSALTWRLPRGIGIVNDHSKCDDCGMQIEWYDNIPLFSYLRLGGKCRNCGKKISLRYPLIEFSAGLIFVLVYSLQGDTFTGIFALPYLFLTASMMVAIFVTDYEYQIIPDEFIFLLFALNLIIFPLFLESHMYEHVFSGFLASLFLLLLHIITKGQGMGLGDVKLALFAGSFFGLKNSISWLFLSFIIGATVGVLLMLIGKASFGKKIAFGPFLVISFFLVMFWGEQITRMLIPYW